MAEGSRRSEPDPEAALRDLAPRLAYPPTPDLALAVRRRLAAQGPARPRPRWWGGWLGGAAARLTTAALALVALLILGLVLWPDARAVVADRLGLRGVDIRQDVPFQPAPPATPSATPSPVPTPGVPTATPRPTPSPIPLGQRLGLGTPVSLAAVRARVPFPVRVPAALGAPDEVYLAPTPPEGQVSLVYVPRPALPRTAETGVGLLLSQFRGTFEPTMGKGLGPETRVEEVTVNGGRGFWLEGRPHLFFYRDSRGAIQDQTLRLAGSVLLWEQGDVTLRIESALPKAEALRIAASVAP